MGTSADLCWCDSIIGQMDYKFMTAMLYWKVEVRMGFLKYFFRQGFLKVLLWRMVYFLNYVLNTFS